MDENVPVETLIGRTIVGVGVDAVYGLAAVAIELDDGRRVDISAAGAQGHDCWIRMTIHEPGACRASGNYAIDRQESRMSTKISVTIDDDGTMTFTVNDGHIPMPRTKGEEQIHDRMLRNALRAAVDAHTLTRNS